MPEFQKRRALLQNAGRVLGSEEADEFERALQDARRIDPGEWRGVSDKSAAVAHRRSPLLQLVANNDDLFLPLIALGEFHAIARRLRHRLKIERQIVILLAVAVLLASTEPSMTLCGAIHTRLALPAHSREELQGDKFGRIR